MGKATIMSLLRRINRLLPHISYAKPVPAAAENMTCSRRGRGRHPLRHWGLLRKVILVGAVTVDHILLAV
jgi:hypothetical protein